MSGRRAFIHSFSLLVIRGSLPTTHSLITVNHLFPGFLLFIQGVLLTTLSLVSVNHSFSRMAADHSFVGLPNWSFAGRCPPLIRRLLSTICLQVSANHSFSCVTADHSFAGFLPVIDCLPPTIFFSQAFLLVICGPQLTTLSMIVAHCRLLTGSCRLFTHGPRFFYWSFENDGWSFTSLRVIFFGHSPLFLLVTRRSPPTIHAQASDWPFTGYC